MWAILLANQHSQLCLLRSVVLPRVKLRIERGGIFCALSAGNHTRIDSRGFGARITNDGIERIGEVGQVFGGALEYVGIGIRKCAAQAVSASENANIVPMLATTPNTGHSTITNSSVAVSGCNVVIGTMVLLENIFDGDGGHY